MIGDGVEVRVLRVSRDGVKLGITAPPAVVVHRREIYDLIRTENEWAARSTGDLRRLMTRVRAPAAPLEE